MAYERLIPNAFGGNDSIREIRVDELRNVGAVLAGLRDHVEDGIFSQTYEPAFWSSKASLCMSEGIARAYCVNGGNIAGVLLVQIDGYKRATIWACNSMWGPESEAELMKDAVAWCAEKGVQLGKFVNVKRLVETTVREWQAV